MTEDRATEKRRMKREKERITDAFEDIFSRFDLAGACGTGLQKIMNDYREPDAKPQILTAPNSFKLILPHLGPGKEPEDGETLPGKEQKHLQKEESILGYLKEHRSITRKDAEALLGVSSATAVRVLRKMARGKCSCGLVTAGIPATSCRMTNAERIAPL